MRKPDFSCENKGTDQLRKTVQLTSAFVSLNRCYNPFTSYSTVQAFFHQPAHPRGEGATIKRISPPRKPPAGGDCGGSAAFPRWVLHIKIDRQSLPVFKFSWSPPRVRGGIK